jgi:hypothetical protein
MSLPCGGASAGHPNTLSEKSVGHERIAYPDQRRLLGTDWQILSIW